jgi:hypothetical protein
MVFSKKDEKADGRAIGRNELPLGCVKGRTRE